MKQALVKQRMNREQENSHLGWPDHTLHPYTACTTLTILAHPIFREIPVVSDIGWQCNHVPEVQYKTVAVKEYQE